MRSLKKFPNAENRLQEIAEDAELHEKSMTDLNFLYHKIKENCEIAVSEANKENVGLKTSKSAFFKIRGVSINAAQLIRSQEEFDPLFKSISALDSSYKYVIIYLSTPFSPSFLYEHMQNLRYFNKSFFFITFMWS